MLPTALILLVVIVVTSDSLVVNGSLSTPLAQSQQQQQMQSDGTTSITNGASRSNHEDENVFCGNTFNLDKMRNVKLVWIPSKSGCILTIVPGRHHLLVDVIPKSPYPMPCGHDFKDWTCPINIAPGRRCAQLLYATHPDREPLDWQQSRSSGGVLLQVKYIRFFYCGVTSRPVTVTIATEGTSKADEDDENSILIRIVIPTLAVVIFVIIVGVFILFAVKWRIFQSRQRNSGSDSRNHRAIFGRRSFFHRSSRNSSGHQGNNEDQPPPPDYQDFHKYPLSERFQRQMTVESLHLRHLHNLSARSSLRSTDTPPPSYNAALVTVSQGQLPPLALPATAIANNGAFINPAYLPLEGKEQEDEVNSEKNDTATSTMALAIGVRDDNRSEVSGNSIATLNTFRILLRSARSARQARNNHNSHIEVEMPSETYRNLPIDGISNLNHLVINNVASISLAASGNSPSNGVNNQSDLATNWRKIHQPLRTTPHQPVARLQPRLHQRRELGGVSFTTDTPLPSSSSARDIVCDLDDPALGAVFDC